MKTVKDRNIENNNIKNQILEKLDEIETRENVKVLYAVESGSRAWGVESPDSDYDVRFIYMRPKEDYIRLDEVKDFIEWQLDDVLDINGWDIKKTLIQFHKGNATLFEWANSPVVYKNTKTWKNIYSECGQYFSRKAALCHYYGTARSTYEKYLNQDNVKYKKYVYALRPLLACKYIEENGKVPPVRFDELMRQKIDGRLYDEINKMLEVKSHSKEKTLNPQNETIFQYIKEELAKYEFLSQTAEEDRNSDWDVLNGIFRKICEGGI